MSIKGKVRLCALIVPLLVSAILLCTCLFSRQAQSAPVDYQKTTNQGLAQEGFKYVEGEIIVKFRLPEGKTANDILRDGNLQAFTNKYKIKNIRRIFKALDSKLKKGLKERQVVDSVVRKFDKRAKRSKQQGNYTLGNIYIIEVEPELNPREVIRELEKNPLIEYAEPHYQVGLDFLPNDPFYINNSIDLYGLRRMQCESAWDISSGSGVVIAISDSGVDYSHPDLSSRIWTNPGEISNNGIDDDNNGYVDDIRGWDFGGTDQNSAMDEDNDPMDYTGHGTASAGAAAAAGNNGIGVIGTAWGAKIMPIKAFADGTFSSGSLSPAINTIYYAVNNGADILNISWGAWGGNSLPYSRALEDAINYAYDLGVVITTSAGNRNMDARNFFPTALRNTISVAATDSSDRRASWSNYGPKIEVAAPGAGILIPVSQVHPMYGDIVYGGDGTVYGIANGTSVSAPYVAGIAALILSLHPEFTNDQIRAVLRASADDIEGTGFDVWSGYGRVNAYRALQFDNPSVSRVIEAFPDTNNTELIHIKGTAEGSDFVSYSLEYGRGEFPSSWTTIGAWTEQVKEGVLGTWDTTGLALDVYTLRLTVKDSGGMTFTDRFILTPFREKAVYHLEEPAGSINDASGNNNTGFSYNAQYGMPGVLGSAMGFDGISSFIDVQDSSSLSITGPMSIDVWFNPTDLSRTTQAIIGKWNDLSGQRSYAIMIENYYQLAFCVSWNGIDESCVRPANTVSTGEWYHAVMVYDGSFLKAYLDGREIGRVEYKNGVFDSNTELRIGAVAASGGSAMYFSGLIDEVIIRGGIVSSQIIVDENIPSTPPGLTVTPVNTSIIELAWAPATDDIGVAGYSIYRDGSLILTTTNTNYLDNGLATNTIYTYTVSAFDWAWNESVPTEPVAVSTLADTMAPSVPGGLVAIAVGTSSIDLAWSPSIDDVAVAGYHIYRDNVQTGVSYNSAYPDIGLSPGISYEYLVSAFDAAGNESARSIPVSAVTWTGDSTIPGIPVGLVALALDGEVTLDWTDNPEADVVSYRVYRSNQAGGPYEKIATSGISAYIDKGLTNGLTYYYAVTAVDGSGNESEKSMAVSANPVDIPDVRAWYRLDDVSGMVIDSSGNKNDGLNYGAVSVSGKVGNAFSFDGLSNYIGVQDSASLDITGALTLGAWFKVDSFANVQAVAGKWDNTNNQRSYVIMLNSYGVSSYNYLDVRVSSNGSNFSTQINTSAYPLQAGRWYHAALLYDGSNVKAYLDGRLIGSISFSGGVYNSDTEFRIGAVEAWVNSPRYFDGIIDEVKVWGEALQSFDIYPPTVPGNLVASAVGISQINLGWSASTDDAGVAGYRVYRDGVLLGNTASTSISDTGLSPGTSYSYSVSAYDSAGNESGKSSLASATTWPDTTPPTIPENLTASANGISRIDLNWLPSTDNIGIASYRIYRNNLLAGSSTNTSYSDTGLSPSTSYNYSVSAFDNSGNESVKSSPASATTWPDITAPTTPTKLMASAISISQISLSWSASTDDAGVAGYRIYRDGVFVSAAYSTSYSDNVLSPATSYSYFVSALDGASNESAPSATASVTTLADTVAPTIPDGLVVIQMGGDRIDLSWTASTDDVGVSGYRIYRDGIFIGSSTTSSYSDGGLSSGNFYSYRVSAFDSAGNESGKSASAGATTLSDITAPAIPSGLMASAMGVSQIDLSWSASTDDVGVVGYRVYRDGVLVGMTGEVSYSNGSLLPNIYYTYTVSAFDGVGNESGVSLPAGATTWADGTSPLVPDGLLASGGDGEAFLDWIDNPEQDLSSYRLYRSTVSGGPYTNAGITGVSSYRDAGVVNGVSYYYVVTAVDTSGNESGLSGETGVMPGPSVNLRAYYPLEDSSGVVVDASGGGNDGTNYGAVAGSGKVGKAFSFDGVSNYIRVPDGVGLDITDALTMEVWFNADSFKNAQAVAGKWDNTNNQRSYVIMLNNWNGSKTYNYLDVRVSSTGTDFSSQINTSAYPLQAGRWYHAALVYDGNTVKAYLDGKMIGSASFSGGVYNSTPEFRIGAVKAWVNAPKYFDGMIDEVKVWKGVKTGFDITPPTIPGGLSASAVGVSRIDLTWTASVDDGVVAGYKVYRNSVFIGITPATSYSDTDLNPATMYSYSVSAFDGSGNESGKSTGASATTWPDTTVPTDPSALVATAMGVSRVALVWSAAGDDVGVSGYRVYRDGLLAGFSASTSYSDTGLNPATMYSYRVSAFDGSGNESGKSTGASATTWPDTTAPAVPSGLVAIVKGASSIDLSWPASSDDGVVAGYRVYRDGVFAGDTSATSYSDTGLSPTTSYSYTVSAYDGAGNESDKSVPVSATTWQDITAPTVPAGLVAAAMETTRIDLSWSASTDDASVVVGYRIYRNGVLAGISGINSYSDTEILPGTTYTYTVSALDDAGNESGRSTPVSATTWLDTMAPTVPAGLAAVAMGTSRIDLSWTPSTDDIGVAGYRIYRDGLLVSQSVATNYSDTLLIPYRTYNYVVSAYDIGGNESLKSAASGATTWVESVSPTQPAGVVASAGDGYVSIDWVDVSEPDMALYKIYRSTVPGGPYVEIATTGISSYRDLSLKNGTTYYYTVSAIDTSGNESLTSGEVSATPVGIVSLQAHYPLEDTGGVVVDASGTGNDGANYGAVPATGKTGNALTYDGINDYIGVPDNAALDISGALTLEAWFKADAFTGAMAVAGKWDNANNQRSYVIMLNNWNGSSAYNYLDVRVSSNGSNFSFQINTSAYPLQAGRWYHAALVYDGVTVKAFLDGIMIGSVSFSGGIFNSTTEFRIGATKAWVNAPRYFDGMIDEVKVSAGTKTGFDTRSPAMPANLTAMVVNTSRIDLGWSASTDDFGVTGYKVYRDGALLGNATATYYSDTGLNPDTIYSYSVSAIDSAGNESAASAISRATTSLSDISAPNVPAGLTAVARNISTIDLNWTASTDDVGVAGYRVYRDGIYLGTSAVPSYSDGGLSSGAFYSYRLSAFDSAGNESAKSPSIGAVPLPDSTAPSVPTGLISSVTGVSQIDLSWFASTDDLGVAGYRVYRDAVPVGMTGGLSYSDASLLPNIYYSYTVSSFDGAGNESGGSLPVGATTWADGTTPLAPEGLVASGGDGEAFLDWLDNAEQDVSSYRVYRSTVSGGPYSNAGVTGASSYRDAGVVNGMSYYYVITALDTSNNESGLSGETGVMPGPSVNLRAYYPLEDSSGVVVDASGGGNDGTNYGAVSGSGKVGNAFSFDGASSYAGIIDNTGLDIRDALTTEVWFKADNFNNAQAVAGKWDNINNQRSYVILLNNWDGSSNYNYLDVRVSSSGIDFSSQINTSAYPLREGRWYHAALVYDGVTVKAYLDGKMIGSISFSRGIHNSDTEFRIGAVEGWMNSPRHFKGIIDEVKIWEKDKNSFDIAPPTVPGGLSATAMGVSRIDLTWTASVDDGVVAGYKVYRDGIFVGTTTTTSFSDTGLNPATMYSYRVSAFDGSGNDSDKSTGASATTWSDTTAPTIPSGLVATDMGVARLGLVWAAASDDVGVSGYRIYRDGLFAGFSASTSYSDTGLNPATMYSYRVSAFDGAGNESGMSASATATTWTDTTAPTAPSGLVPIVKGASRIDLSWSASSDDGVVAGYRVYRDGVFAGATPGTSYSDTGLSPTTSYSYSVSAYDGAGNESGRSLSASATTWQDITAPTVPAGLAAVAMGTTRIDLSWSASVDDAGVVAGYRIYRNGVLAGVSGINSYSDMEILPGTTYTYTVSALDNAGNESVRSLSASAATWRDTTAPTVPAGLATVVMGTSRIDLSWMPSFDDIGVAGYRIYRHGLQVGVSTNTYYSDTVLTPNTLYSYAVIAVDSAGNESEKSIPAEATTWADADPPAAPAGLTATPGDKQILLEWPDNIESDILSYEIFRSLTSGGPYTKIAITEINSYRDTNLANWTLYYYVITSVDTSGNKSGFSMEISGAPNDLVNLRAYYPLGDNGAVALDATQKGNNGVKSGGVATVTGKAGDAFSFDGINDYIWVTDNGELDITGVLTVETWFKADGFNNAQAIAGKWDNTNNQRSYVIMLNNWKGGSKYNYLDVRVSSSGGNYSAQINTSSYPLQAGRWYHTALVYDGSSVKAYLDGKMIGSVSFSGGLYNSSAEFRIGATKAWVNAPRYFDGMIDEVRIWAESKTYFDTTPPFRPTNLSAEASLISQIDLVWTPTTDDTGVAGYKIYRDTIFVGTSDIPQYSDTGLYAGTVYTYTVSAYDTMGNESAKSDPVSAVTMPDTLPPTAPSGLTATVISASKIDLRWVGSSDDNGVAGYRIYRDGVMVGVSPTVVYSDSGLMSDTSYSYVVSAYDRGGNESARSESTMATTWVDVSAPSVPSGLSGNAVGISQIDLTWSAAVDDVGVEGYRIYRDGILIGSSPSPNYSDTGLSSGTAYSYTVSAYDMKGNESALSLQVAAATWIPDTIPPFAPTLLKGSSSGASQIDLSWQPSTDNVGVTGYRIYRDGISVSTSNTTAFSDTGLSPGTTYTYQVSAYDQTGNESGRSVAASVTTGAPDNQPPSIPSGFTATAKGISRIELSWNPSTDNVGVKGYKVFRDGLLIGISNPSTGYMDTDLLPGTLYSYVISAYDAGGNESLRSTAASVSTWQDTTPPLAPTDLISTAISDSTIDLAWNAAIDNLGVAGYRIYRDGTFVGTSDSTSYSAQGLKPVTSYTFETSAYDAAGNESSKSNSASAMTKDDSTPPSIPVDLSGTPTSTTSITLSWTPSSDNGTVAGYRVYRDGIMIGTSTDAAYLDTGLKVSTNYIYRVSAFDAANNESGLSAPVTVKTLRDNTKPTKPGGLQVTPKDHHTILNWEDNSEPDLSLYRVYRSTATGGPYSEAGTSTISFYVDTGLTNGTTYYYVITAVDTSDNESVMSSDANATPAVSPNLLAEYHLDDSGSVIEDSSGKGNHGINFGGVKNFGKEWPTGPVEKYGLSFNGVDSYVEVTDSSSLSFTGPFTVEAWFRPRSFDQPQAILGKWDDNSDQRSFIILLNRWGGSSKSNYIDVRISSTGGDVSPQIDTSAYPLRSTEGRWYHVAMVYDGTDIKVYLDGVLIGTQPFDKGLYASNAPLRIGAVTTWEGAPGNFDGFVDEVKIWSEPKALIDGYSSATSVNQGGAIDFHISTESPLFDIHIFREGAREEYKTSLFSLPGNFYEVPVNGYSVGYGWPVAATLQVPPEWRSGVYVARLVTATSSNDVIFVVREDVPGSSSKILVELGVNTYHAYNNAGGKSLYNWNSSDAVTAYKVSFDRPYNRMQAENNESFWHWEYRFIQWAESNGYTLEYATNIDLHDDSTFLQNYHLMLSIGHDEYWSKEMRDQVERFIADGGNVAFFGANVSWWQVRFEDNNRTMISYKDYRKDPLFGVDNSRVTDLWNRYPVNRPENVMTGVSFKNGGYVNVYWPNGTSNFPATDGYGDYTVYNSDHWLYEGTGLVDGQEFGWDETIVGMEVDGAKFTWQGGKPKVTGADGTPLNFEILGLSPSAKEDGTTGYATMGVFTNGGTVFTSATEDWSHGLATNPYVQKITRNILDRLSIPPPRNSLIRYEEDSSLVAYVGSWNKITDSSASGCCYMQSTTAGSAGIFSFIGTEVYWISSKGDSNGIAKVYIDGIYDATVDLYDPSNIYPVIVYEKKGLPPGAHTIKIEVTGTANPQSRNKYVYVDAFDAMTTVLNPENPVARYEETSPYISYSGMWTQYQDSVASGGGIKESITGGSTATFSFYGTEVYWLSSTWNDNGIARVYLNGQLDGTIDLNSPANIYPRTVYGRWGLTLGYHTLTIEVTGMTSSPMPGGYVYIDAFDVGE